MINNNELISKIKSYNKFLNSETLNKAYSFDLEAHQNQKREEGVPYIIHPVAVAKILTELNRQFLHAKTLGFVHPKKNKKMIFHSNIPEELEIILKTLRNTNK